MIRRIARDQQTLRLEPLQTPRHEHIEASAQATGNPAQALRRALILLLGEELRLSPEHIHSVVERELCRVKRATKLELCLHPEDLVLLEQSDAFPQRLELRGSLTLTPDPGISRGGCVLRTDLGEIDARLETRLALALALVSNEVM